MEPALHSLSSNDLSAENVPEMMTSICSTLVFCFQSHGYNVLRGDAAKTRSSRGEPSRLRTASPPPESPLLSYRGIPLAPPRCGSLSIIKVGSARASGLGSFINWITRKINVHLPRRSNGSLPLAEIISAGLRTTCKGPRSVNGEICSFAY